MDIAALRWFQQVADGTTVTEVGDLEAISQSGVSRALARLESELGTPLLRRSGRTLRMTRAGATFKRHVDRLLHELDDGLAAVSELASPDTGVVSIAFQLSFGTWLVPRLIAGFLAPHPNVQFELQPLRREGVSSGLLKGSVDVEITTVRPDDERVSWRPLLVEPLRLAVPRGQRFADRTSISLVEASGERFVTLHRSYALRVTGDALCRQAGFEPVVAFEADDLPTVEGMVGAGLGVAIVPGGRYRLTTPTDADVMYVDIADAGASRPVGIAWSADRRLLPSAERFREYVVAQARRV